MLMNNQFSFKKVGNTGIIAIANAIAERINGIIKMECVYRQKRLMSYECAQNFISRYILFL